MIASDLSELNAVRALLAAGANARKWRLLMDKFLFT